MDDFDKNIESIKSKINKVELSEEYKENLKKKLDLEFYGEENEKKKTKTRRKSFIPKYIATGIAACVFFSTLAFADEIDDFVQNIFSNTYQDIEYSVKNGNVQEIDMEYVEHDGVSIKVDYVVKTDNSICIAFNVLSEEEFDKVVFCDLEIRNENNEIIYMSNTNVVTSDIQVELKRKSLKEAIFFVELEKINNIDYFENLNIIVNKIKIKKDNNIEYIEGSWKIDNVRFKFPSEN